MSMIVRTYERLPDRVQLQFFRHPGDFRHHARKHFLSAAEPWSEILPSFPRGDPDKWNDRTTDQAYEQAVEVLEEGIRSAEERLLFVRFRERRRPAEGGAVRETKGIYLLAREGYVVVVEADIVRTAYFCGKHPEDPWLVRFEKGWNHIKKRERYCRSRECYHDEVCGELVQVTNFDPHSPPNWEQLPALPGVAPAPAGPLPSGLARCERAAKRYRGG
jgi:hypothetical protein